MLEKILLKLVTKRQNSGIEYLKFKANLEANKEKLFSYKNITKWDIEPNSNIDEKEILNNKNLAFPLMCNKV